MVFQMKKPVGFTNPAVNVSHLKLTFYIKLNGQSNIEQSSLLVSVLRILKILVIYGSSHKDIFDFEFLRVMKVLLVLYFVWLIFNYFGWSV